MQNDDFVNIVREEAYELLDELEQIMLELESDPGNMDQVASAFRALHSIKGSGSMAGFDALAEFTHGVENVFDKVRSGELKVTHDLLTLTLKAKDHINNLLSSPAEGSDDLNALSASLLGEFKEFTQGQEGAEDAKIEAPDLDSEEDIDPADLLPSPVTYWVCFRSRENFVDVHPACEKYLDALKGRGVHLEYVLHDPEEGLCGFDLCVSTDKTEDYIRRRLVILPSGDLFVYKIVDTPLRHSDFPAILKKISEDRDKEPEVLAQEFVVKYSTQVAKRGTGEPPAAKAPETSSIRVDSNKLDLLVDMVGELVILQSRLAQVTQGVKMPVLTAIAEDFERLTAEMRDQTLGIRMLPIGTSFGLFKRLVRDLCNSLDKEVEFVTEGASTELDKTVIDKLKDPVMHILRNSMDHGFEHPEEREKAGKPRAGRLVLRADHVGGEVVIAITDDGKGIDKEAIRQKAVDNGLIHADAEMSDKDVLKLIFEPGFSTAKAVTGVSGRGVGMDVVKRGIDALRGHIDLETEKGVGTTLTVRLPLTLAIIDGMMVKIEDETYILPLTLVDSCQERFVEEDGVKELDVINVRGKMIPCLSLRRLLNVPGRQPDYERVLVVFVDGYLVGLAVDTVIGRQQAVIKNLGNMLDDISWVSGTTIGGDGDISLILDVQQIVRHVSDQVDMNKN